MSQGQGPTGPETSPLDPLRAVLLAAAQGKELDPGRVGLAGTDATLAGLCAEFLRFAAAIDLGVQYFLLELNVGPALNTLQMRGQGKLLTNQVKEALERPGSSLVGLRETLERNRKFLILLNEAYRAAIPGGVQKLLSEVVPQESRQAGTAFMAWMKAKRALADLSVKAGEVEDLPPADLIQRFFQQSFQDELVRLLGP